MIISFFFPLFIANFYFIRAQYFAKNVNKVIDITPPVIAPFMPPLPGPIPAPFTRTSCAEWQFTRNGFDLPEKEFAAIDFKNLSHELTYNPVVSKLWDRIARFTSDLKKETFGGRQHEGMLLLLITLVNVFIYSCCCSYSLG